MTGRGELVISSCREQLTAPLTVSNAHEARPPAHIVLFSSLFNSTTTSLPSLPSRARPLSPVSPMTISLPWPLSHLATQLAAPVPAVTPASTVRPSSIASLLRHYETPGVPPPSSRVDPLLPQKGGHVMGLRDLFALSGLVALKATEVASDVVSHHLWGPRKKSWSLPMTILAGIMRDAGRHSNLVNIATIRMFLGLGGLVPLPPDALVTPVTFRVRKRGLRGILAEFDQFEDGTRELSGEWVVTKRLWQRLQAEWKASQPKPHGDHPSAAPRKHHNERIILYLHGGAYYLFSPATHRAITVPLSKFADARVFAVAYRLAPETRFPGPLHDAVSTYFRLLDDLHIPPSNILFAGDSAGGALCLALLMYLRDNNYPLPAGAILMSPWVDLTRSCDSWDSNAPYDIVPIPSNGDHLDPVACYLGPHMERYLTHPYASPLFGDFKGLPPMLIQAGDSEVLRDEITLLAHKATLAGVQVMHELYEDAVHVFQAFPFLEATQHAFLSCRAFVRHEFALAQPQGSRPLDDNAEAELAHEIDNERAHLVRGDGQDKPSSEGKASDDSEQSGSDATDEDSDEASLSGDDSPSRTPGADHYTQSVSTPRGRGFTPDKSDSSQHSPSTSPLRSRRVQSHYNLEYAHFASPSRRAQRPSLSRAHSGVLTPRHLRMTTLSSAPVPSPSIRSSSSHPDISSLCDQWGSTGPANVTLTYKPSGATASTASSSKSSRGHKRSPTFHYT
ncbi:Alpha/Beta hydrolase protein [Gloeopeniophorella convolvens]|nr:Alpha/Beta hydrolase protein [Gloeopeniophorella convolvens]